MEYATSLVIILSTYVLLRLIYRIVEFNWPEEYFNENEKEGIFFAQSLPRYVIFRLLPPLLTIFVVLAISQKDSQVKTFNPIVLGFISAFVYSFYTDGLALIKIYKKARDIKIYDNVAKQCLFHFGAIISISGIGVVAGYISKFNQLYFLLPNSQGVIDNFWTAFITAFVFFVYKKSHQKFEIKVTLDDSINKSSNDIPPYLFSLIEEESKKNNANETLVKAICIAENLQRPKWFRSLETIISKFGSRGSYGIMQVQTDKPISDSESVKLAITKYFKDTKWKSKSEIDETIHKYNNSENYVSLVNEIINYIDPIENRIS